jgi:hypothetical protein
MLKERLKNEKIMNAVPVWNGNRQKRIRVRALTELKKFPYKLYVASLIWKWLKSRF